MGIVFSFNCPSQKVCFLQTDSKTVHQQKDYGLLKAQMIAFFSSNVFLRHNAIAFFNRLQYNAK